MSAQIPTAPTAIYSIMTPALQSPIRLDARRCARRPTRRVSRPRHSKRIVESTLHPFDRLPWISALDVSPDVLDPIDIADLSQLVVDDECGAPLSGPIRRRRTSLRSSPIALVPKDPDTTPASRFNPSRVLFHDLMPTWHLTPSTISCGHNARS
ncbi:hypothetical protein FB45DRAFT_912601 [Roridomyces roridus]|uniref:Uncharacterized protein n=1 Tax=Roridomyces roridus TaxID=1738132 RepID=A0AAD7FQP8_9AGAR|nr:hypothetical protein FB45DRAFT_912601 [Roridomyces roridus]